MRGEIVMQATANHFQAALSLSALGDALGWPQEFKRYSSGAQLRQFVSWKKNSGGKYWAYQDPIRAGEYSDDTQLMLAIARSILPDRTFWPEYFAYLELPLWLHYERGGGRATKQAARNLLKYKTLWSQNIFGSDKTNYDSAGGNGAAMRTLPISLARANDLEALLKDTLSQALITHGHPRGIVGTLVLACAHYQIIQDAQLHYKTFGQFVKHTLGSFFNERLNWSEELLGWWQARSMHYLEMCLDTLEETLAMLRLVPEYLSQPPENYFQKIGCFSSETKGSGTATVAGALFLYFQFRSQPEEAIFAAANLVGSDTDTIASMVGGLAGLQLGEQLTPELQTLSVQIQDYKYLSNLGKYLFELVKPVPQENLFEKEKQTKTDKKESLKIVLSWEMGLHELFWDLLNKGDMISHPTLGMGRLLNKAIYPIANRIDYETRVFQVRFDTSQTVYFHSRVSKENFDVEQSLGKTVRKELSLAG